MTEIKVKLSEGAQMPEKATDGSSGYDLRATHAAEIWPRETVKISTGISIGLPPGWEAQVRSRSGLANKRVVVANSPGTVDRDYRGVVGVLLHNQGVSPLTVNPGDRIAQLVFQRVPDTTMVPVDELDETDRGSGGFGSTGVE